MFAGNDLMGFFVNFMTVRSLGAMNPIQSNPNGYAAVFTINQTHTSIHKQSSLHSKPFAPSLFLEIHPNGSTNRGSPPLWSVCWWFFSDPRGSPNLTSSIYPLCSHNPNSCIRCKSTDLSWRPPIGPLILKCCQFYKVVPPRYPLVNKHRYWKWPFIVDLSI